MCKILVDMLGLQTDSSRFRGIGRYTEAMTMALIEEAGSNVSLLINQKFDDAAKAIERTFLPLIGKENLHYYDVLQGTDTDRKEVSALLRELAIDYIQPDVVFCPSFFENSDQAIITINKLSNIPVVTTIHDLIPLVQKHLYLDPHPTFKSWYLKKVDELRHGAGFLAISEFSKAETIEYLKVNEASVCNTYEGAFGNFRKLDDRHQFNMRERLRIDKDYIFYTGGGDPRKNLVNLFEAYALLPGRLRENHQIIIAGKIEPKDKAELVERATLLGISDCDYKFLGFVSDEDLVRLYNAASIFVFPSLHEGFGLPAVEAMQCDTPLIGANMSSLIEIIGNPEALFDPYNPSDIAQKIELVLTDETFRTGLLSFARRHVQQFSWSRSAKVALEYFKKIHCELGYKATSFSSWRDVTTFYNRRDIVFTELLSSMEMPKTWTDEQLKVVSELLVHNRLLAETKQRASILSLQQIEWRLEGPFDSSYSLAIVNRNLAKALNVSGVKTALHSSEGPGDFDPDKQFLECHSDIEALHNASVGRDAETFTVTSRNMYPPRASEMVSLMNGFHNYAWEETGFPLEYTAKFNQNLQFVTVTSEHVKKVLIDNGVNVPVVVTGNGVDHWQNIEPGCAPEFPKSKFVFLHVSSCFPRKGPDILLESYGQAFSSQDDVLLIIKTFDNPHNELRDMIASCQRDNPDYPAVHVIDTDLSDQDLKALYLKADWMVLPSRAEGFGLPIAEAVLSGLPVLTTGWSGGLDIARAGAVRLIDFEFSYARSHLAAQSSVWAEPNVSDLANLMRKAYDGLQPLVSSEEMQTAQSKLLSQFSWKNVASRNVEAIYQSSQIALKSEPRIGWISTFYKECGIATYSEHLLSALNMPVVRLADYGVNHSQAQGDAIECWRQGNDDDLEELYDTIVKQNLDLIVLQFNYGFFDFSNLSRLIKRLKSAGYCVVVFMHSTSDKIVDIGRRLSSLSESLSICDRLVVHSINDLNRLKEISLHHKATLFPHGVIPYKGSVSRKVFGNSKRGRRQSVVIGSYGFFLPQKGLLELIDAVALLRKKEIDVRLVMVNSKFPADISDELILAAHEKIQQLGLDDFVELHTEFLSDSQSMQLLQKCDLVAFPYQQNGESASGAVRYGIASGLPVAVTPVNIFDDIRTITWQLPGTDVDSLTNGLYELIEKILHKDEEIAELASRSNEWREAHAYPILGYRLRNMLSSLYRNS